MFPFFGTQTIQSFDIKFQNILKKNKFVTNYFTGCLFQIYAPTGSKFPLTKAWFERCKSAMKDFEKVNTKGANDLAAAIKEKL